MLTLLYLLAARPSVSRLFEYGCEHQIGKIDYCGPSDNRMSSDSEYATSSIVIRVREKASLIALR